MDAVVFLPDVEKGYYRGARFDWSGLVACVSLNGHTFFGEWFNRYDPLINDAVTGPAEEFREPIGYDNAKTGDAFVKIGAGVLKRIDDQPYTFGGAYPILDHGKWTVKVHKDSITFRQELHSTIGYAYLYEKTLSLDKKTNSLQLSHSLKNIGTKPLILPSTTTTSTYWITFRPDRACRFIFPLFRCRPSRSPSQCRSMAQPSNGWRRWNRTTLPAAR